MVDENNIYIYRWLVVGFWDDTTSVSRCLRIRHDSGREVLSKDS